MNRGTTILGWAAGLNAAPEKIYESVVSTINTALANGADDQYLSDCLLRSLNQYDYPQDSITEEQEDAMLAGIIDESIDLHASIEFWEQQPTRRMPRHLFKMMNEKQTAEFYEARRLHRAHPFGRPRRSR